MPQEFAISSPAHPDLAPSALQPASAYRQRILELRQHEKQLQREHILLGYLRLAFGLATVVLIFRPTFMIVLPLAAFIFAARVHDKKLKRLAGVRRSITFYEHGLARVEDRWAGVHPRAVSADLSKSLYAQDLDLFGDGSVFELLCLARTSVGEDTLRDWLLHGAAGPELAERQRCVLELAPGGLLRETLAVAPGPTLATLDRKALRHWAETADRGLPAFLRWLAPLLVLLTAAAAWRYAVTQSPVLLVLALIIDASLTFSYKRQVKSRLAGAQQVGRALYTAAFVLADFERHVFSSPRLQLLQQTLHASGTPASQAIRSLGQLSQWIDARGNYVVRILDAPLLYSLQLTFVVARWQQRHGSYLNAWLDSLGEIEALYSLAGYSYEHPEDVFPEVTETEAMFVARGLGHPLLPNSACVRNDVSLDRRSPLLLVSGSNMSGKSTLLRSVGVNAVLAFAGAPVRASSLTISRLAVAASIQVQDSLQAGRSRFYAEILRLRAITEIANERTPVLFLLDELLAGTNSSDRLEGARGLVTSLLAKGAIGLVSTHDLALTSIGTGGDTAVVNMHFEDQIVDGELGFDYVLRPGPVTRSNGVALMRMVGLDV